MVALHYFSGEILTYSGTATAVVRDITDTTTIPDDYDDDYNYVPIGCCVGDHKPAPKIHIYVEIPPLDTPALHIPPIKRIKWAFYWPRAPTYLTR